MKVRFLTSVATASDSFEQDEVRDISELQAAQFVRAGIAEPVQLAPETRKPAARRPLNSAASAA